MLDVSMYMYVFVYKLSRFRRLIHTKGIIILGKVYDGDGFEFDII